MSQPQESKKKIIIVGAGIAGLSASAYLIKYGYDVEILEARSYCGGRICTDHTLGIPLGRGAAWIHGDQGNPMAELANSVGAKFVAVNPSQFAMYDDQSNLIPQSELQKFDEKFAQLLQQAKEFSFKQNEDISLAAALKICAKDVHLTLAEQKLLTLKLSSMESYIGANSESISARFWDQEEPWPGENCFLLDSYQPIIENLSKQSVIRLNTVVSCINRC